MIGRAIEVRTYFRNKLKNTFLTVAADDVSEAKRIVKVGGERRPAGDENRFHGKFPSQKESRR
jgi:hypothetical protein